MSSPSSTSRPFSIHCTPTTTMPRTDLPPECLELIFAYLALENDTSTLASLLCVSKAFCAVALPFLYANPLQLLEFSRRRRPRSDQGDDDDPGTAFVKLAGLLLRSSEQDTVTNLLKAAYYDDVDEGHSVDAELDKEERKAAVAASRINYLHYLRHLHLLDSDSKNPPVFHNTHHFENKTLTRYLEHSGLAASYHSRELSLEFNPYRPLHATTLQYLSVDLRVQLTWALCFPVLEQIQSLVIPLSDIRRYQEVIPRLRSLMDLSFKLDQKLEYPHYVTAQLQEEDPGKYEAMVLMRSDALNAIVEFVRDHTLLFPRLLRSVNCPDNRTWPGVPQSCPQWAVDMMQDCIPPLERPLWLDSSNWSHFLAKIESTDLSQVEVIRAPCDDPARWFGALLQRDVNFLPRCVRLKELVTISLGPTTFKWAYEEAMRRQSHTRLQLYESQLSALRPPSPPQVQPDILSFGPTQPLPQPTLSTWEITYTSITEQALPPLEYLRLRCYNTLLGSALTDAMIAFSDTLSTIIIDHNANSTIANTGAPGFGNIVKLAAAMPILRRMVVKVQSERVVLGQNFLSNCPALEHLEMEDRATRLYWCSEPQRIGANLQFSQDRSKSVLPSALRTLKLDGWSALTFHPATLNHMPLLETLSLSVGCMSDRTHIPPVAQLQSVEFASLREEEDHLNRQLATNRESDKEYRSDEAGYSKPQRSSKAYMIRAIEHKRPFWTWDWYLPRLTCLRLTGEFAWRFEFRMLAGCPNLESLVLIMATQDDLVMVVGAEEDLRHQQQQQAHQKSREVVYEHQRTIGIQDFFLRKNSRPSSISGSVSQASEQHVVANNLKTLYLYGRWYLSDDSLLFMLHWVMPNLEELHESQCFGYTTKGWIRATGRPQNLKLATSTRIVSEERLTEMGLEKYVVDTASMPAITVREQVVDGIREQVFKVIPATAETTAGPSPIARPFYRFNDGQHYVKRISTTT
ncbi:hypothetical protein BGZ99_005539 [Dissophora globulifera]|uniref:F-box domain-containing protein n=1 Tax=Dissophora globulifera TaxID=979702 RepID=A0A9P6RV75_9FUNG|nr:hypothetical protein BGZ99_005539 [Dissophora globulifera]